MEHLLRLAGLLSEDDNGQTDLGTLERRLAEKTATSAGGATSSGAAETPASAARADTATSLQSAPQSPTLLSSTSAVTSPEPPKEAGKEEEVEALSDMMCSLVTNNCGETRYIGSSALEACRLFIVAERSRLVIRLLNLLAKRHTVGE